MLEDTHIISLEYNKQIELGSNTVEPLINDHQQKTTPLLRPFKKKKTFPYFHANESLIKGHPF